MPSLELVKVSISRGGFALLNRGVYASLNVSGVMANISSMYLLKKWGMELLMSGCNMGFST